MSFKCVLISPERMVLDESVTQAIVPAFDGLIGFLDGRAPILLKLGIGPLRLDFPGGKQRLFLVEGGIAQMKGAALTILTQTAIPAEEITPDSARAEFAEASARRITDEASFETRQAGLRRAAVKAELSGRRN